MKNIALSLQDLLGTEYTLALSHAAAALYGFDPAEAAELIARKVDFFPASFSVRAEALAARTGEALIPPLTTDNDGAATESFKEVAHDAAAPLGGLGCMRLGEDGRLYMCTKSEHYHASLGHNFPGYALIRLAKQLGVTNAAHNNTRGYITRLTERRLIQAVNGLPAHDEKSLAALLAARAPKVLNRVINLETGSLAVEAGLKMMLARFYKLDKTFPTPSYDGRIPVFLVMQDYNGGPEANYHGTTITAQTLRGMWPEMSAKFDAAGAYKIVSVAQNDIGDFEAKLKKYNDGVYKTAGFLHEIVLMNYGALCLSPEYLRAAYELCAAYDTPVMVDEIQSCMWFRGMFLFRQYGLRPDFVILGKGFPGGEYAASKVITTFEMDSLNQFGALVTNGQEELASLAYLITMAFVQQNGDDLEAQSRVFRARLDALQAKHPHIITAIEGQGFLCGIHFATVEHAVEFCRLLNGKCIDVSAQTYKANCPPAALLKPPVILGDTALDVLCTAAEDAVAALDR